MRYNYYFLLILSCLSFLSCSHPPGFDLEDRQDSVVMHLGDEAIPESYRITLSNYSPKAFRNCYIPYLEKFNSGKLRGTPKQGELKFSISLDSEGKVLDVTLANKTSLPRSVSECVAKGINNLSFSRSRYNHFKLIYPLKLKFNRRNS